MGSNPYWVLWYCGCMAELAFNAEADAALTALENDPARAHLLDRIMDTLQQIADEAPPVHVRQRRCQQHDVWGVAVRTADDDYLILWSDTTGEVIVHYIGNDL